MAAAWATRWYRQNALAFSSYYYTFFVLDVEVIVPSDHGCGGPIDQWSIQTSECRVSICRLHAHSVGGCPSVCRLHAHSYALDDLEDG